MKSEKEIQEMYSFIGFFNDGRFMNQDYREGLLTALSFVLFKGHSKSLSSNTNSVFEVDCFFKKLFIRKYPKTKTELPKIIFFFFIYYFF